MMTKRQTDTMLKGIDSRKIIGVGMECVLREDHRIVMLYADVGRRFDLNSIREEGGFSHDIGID